MVCRMNSCSNFALCAAAWRNWRPLAVGLVLATWSTQGFAGEKTVEIVGHRGASYDAPENTLASIRLAWQQQADAVEFDVWQSKDGQIVLLHDKDTKRTAGVEGKVDERTYAELSRLDVGSWKSPEFAGEKIATLSEALKLTPAGKRVFIEVKCGPEVVPELKRVLMPRIDRLRKRRSSVSRKTSAQPRNANCPSARCIGLCRPSRIPRRKLGAIPLKA